ncbi:protein ycf2 [Phtheirospermum japonicum]|uniref:Protein ycf2 n=1 Tax=Phtheirospermum japonicum TaxID=374723 RepID=A0A830B5R9_9LAMI|nr:protein ycf2 [Phtheirospermum japonicum]
MKRVEKGQMYRTFQRDSAFSTLSKWNLFQTYMPWLLTSTGKKFVSIFHDIMHGSGISWRILQKKWYLPQWNLISEYPPGTSDAFLAGLVISIPGGLAVNITSGCTPGGLAVSITPVSWQVFAVVSVKKSINKSFDILINN